MWKRCDLCESYKTCKRLCASKEEYVNQDYTPLREYLLPGNYGIGKTTYPIEYAAYRYGLPQDYYNDIDPTGLNLSFLTPHEEECLLLYYFEGRTMKEIGKMMGLSQKTVSYHIKTARMWCRRKFVLLYRYFGKDARKDGSYGISGRYHPNRPSIGWEGMLVFQHIVLKRSFEKCREFFKSLEYNRFGNNKKALSTMRRAVKIYKKDRPHLIDKIRKGEAVE